MKAEILTREYLETPGQRSCHAATVAMWNGVPAAAWFAGTAEKNPDVRIWFSRRDGAWSTPRAVTPANGVADWNPTLFSEAGRLTMIYKEGVDERHWYSLKMVSSDGGESWSEPAELVPGDVGGRGPVKNQMIRLSDGALLAPGSTEDLLERWEAWTDRSEDGGETWLRSAPVAFRLPSGKVCLGKEDLEENDEGLIQPAVWEDPQNPGHVGMLVRTSFGSVYDSRSEDFGRTWSVARPTAMPNNNSGLGAAVTASGLLALVCNPVAENWGDRTPLSLFLSEDNGETFPFRLDLETEPGVEFSYPSVIADGDTLHVVYTCARERIGYAGIRTVR
ncbi:MAG: exo-alpha-sialidase [Oscillospiraceae bacterium]|jgi:predicted neuraminidase|nr:exo-alpha-sialidase [Oscillospiraceae bacterium]